MFCTGCGKELVKNYKFCTGCGKANPSYVDPDFKKDVPIREEAPVRKETPAVPEDPMPTVEPADKEPGNGNKNMIILLVAVIVILLAVIGVVIGMRKGSGAKNSGTAKQEIVDSPKEEQSADIPKTPDAPTHLGGAEESDAWKSSPEIQAYCNFLESVLYYKQLPDGMELNDGSGNMYDNTFAFVDVDRDGRMELVFDHSETYSANQSARIYKYDPTAACEVEEKYVIGAGDKEFYDTGYVIDFASHNHGMGVDVNGFWPYEVHLIRGNEAYMFFYTVDAWSCSYAKEDYEGNPFPEDVDKDGNGVVYRITEGFSPTRSIDDKEYKEFAKQFGNKLPVEYYKFTESNIRRFCDSYTIDDWSGTGNFSGGDVFPYSSESRLNESEIMALSDEDLRMAINEIYARNGRLFKDEAIQAYFDSCSWYHGMYEPDYFDKMQNQILSKVEQDNIALLAKERKRRN